MRVDAAISAARTALTKAALTVEGKSYTISRVPEVPLGGLETDADKYPMVLVEVSDETRGAIAGGKAYSLRCELTFIFVVHRSTLSGHSTIKYGPELARKGSAAVDDVLSALGASWCTGMKMAEWSGSRAEAAAGDEEQQTWAHSSTWELTYTD